MDAIIKQAVKDELSSIQRDNTRNNESSSQSKQKLGKVRIELSIVFPG